MFLNCAYRCQRVTTAPFPMTHALVSHANQKFVCSSYYEFLRELRRLRRQALHPLLPAPLMANNSRTTSVGLAIGYIILFRKTRAELYYRPPKYP
ncbi:hypothetical protein AXF42_Ash014951 [Apostasia shenzhenica]|uniref:Uncharacterized protein n=1 Tax=Apostasia shenzhenica TaxID=1088818 RepID=A0A2I0ALK6_9ASPA|nr:hypothetical protein AXF42_Ash014951 [Apostasia shenzhenica]